MIFGLKFKVRSNEEIRKVGMHNLILFLLNLGV